MQKISTYLYPNRIELLADLAGFTVEYTNVYQRNIKIYSGIDNVLEFDIKNADQKRIDLAVFTMIQLNVMDATGKELACSPYIVTPTAVKGIAAATIPQADLEILDGQFLGYSITGVKNGQTVILYADTRFGALGKMELIKNVIPWHSRQLAIYNSFTGEFGISTKATYHTSAIPSTFYEADVTPALRFTVEMTGFIGRVWLMGTTQATISHESFKKSVELQTRTFTTPNSDSLVWTNVPIGDFKYFRVYYEGDLPYTPTGSINRVIVNSDVCSDPYNTFDGGNSQGGQIIINGGGSA